MELEFSLTQIVTLLARFHEVDSNRTVHHLSLSRALISRIFRLLANDKRDSTWLVFSYNLIVGGYLPNFDTLCYCSFFFFFQLLHMPFNPFTWDESSTLVSSTIVDVKIRYTQGDRQMISILNLTEDIDLQIPVSTSGSGTEPAMFYIPDDNQTIHYHSFVIEQTNQAAEVHIQPVEKRVKLTVLVQYGRKPTLTNYDYQATLPNYTNCPVDGAAQDAADCKDNPYSLFLPSTYLTIRGTYYVGVKYEKVDKNYSSDHSRGRRGCGRGGRSKRSCIKYKDPPTSLPSGGKFVLATQKSYDKTKHDNYTLEQLSLGCNFWNPSANKFSSGGCRVSVGECSSNAQVLFTGQSCICWEGESGVSFRQFTPLFQRLLFWSLVASPHFSYISTLFMNINICFANN